MNNERIYFCEVIWFDDQEVELKVTNPEEQQFLLLLDRNLFEGMIIENNKWLRIISNTENFSVIKIEEYKEKNI